MKFKQVINFNKGVYNNHSREIYTLDKLSTYINIYDDNCKFIKKL